MAFKDKKRKMEYQRQYQKEWYYRQETAKRQWAETHKTDSWEEVIPSEE